LTEMLSKVRYRLRNTFSYSMLRASHFMFSEIVNAEF